MKQSDIVSIIVVALVGVLVSYFSMNAILSNPDEAEVSFKTVTAVDNDLAEPDPSIFNSAAENPTVEVYVGGCVDANQNGILDEEENMICGTNTIEISDDSDENSSTDSESDDTSDSNASDSSSASNSSIESEGN